MRAVAVLACVLGAGSGAASAAAPVYPSLIAANVRGDYAGGEGYADMEPGFYQCIVSAPNSNHVRKVFFYKADKLQKAGRLDARMQLSIVNDLVIENLDYCFRRHTGGTYSAKRIFDILNTSGRP